MPSPTRCGLPRMVVDRAYMAALPSGSCGDATAASPRGPVSSPPDTRDSPARRARDTCAADRSRTAGPQQGEGRDRRDISTPAPAARRAGSYAPFQRDRRLLASAHAPEATAVPVRIPLLRPAAPGRRAALESGRQDLPPVREAHRHPVRERAVGLPRVTFSAAVVEASAAPDTTL